MITIGVITFVMGIIVGGFHYQPYGIIHSVYVKLMPPKIDLSDTVESHYKEVNVSSLVHISNETDLISKRKSVINYIWKQDGFPHDKMPSHVEQNIHDDRFSEMNNLAQIDKITIKMDYGIDSNSYLFLASKTNHKLVVYQQGHDGGFVLGKNTIQFFLDNGYSVLAFSMPLMEPNSQPVINLPDFGIIKLTTHDDFKFIESQNLSTIKFFLEPIAVSLNFAEEQYKFESYDMVGISGGGWTTVIYAAIDPRISKSYPVAGSLPMYLRFNQNRNLGDYEQTLPELYHKAEYLELYVMGAYGSGRDQLQKVSY